MLQRSVMLTELLRRSHKGVLIDYYRGIGDCIIVAPIFIALGATFESPLYFPQSEGSRLLSRLLPASVRLPTFHDPTMRGLLSRATPLDIGWLEQSRVGAIVSLRRDSLIDHDRFHERREQLYRHGIEVFDLSEHLVVDEQRSDRVFDMLRCFFSRLGVCIPDCKPGWLRPYLADARSVAPRDAVVGVFVGASTAPKRLPLPLWIKVLKELHRSGGVRIRLFSGLSEIERREALDLYAKLQSMDIACELIIERKLHELVPLMMELSVLVSCDTFSVHLAEALDISCVGIYSATDPLVYGPRSPSNFAVGSSYYSRCPRKNNFANCDAWDFGCGEMPCRLHIDADEIVQKTIEQLRDDKHHRN